jgi:ankyrin repeat protein
VDACKLLLEKEASVNAVDESGRTPVFYVKRLDVAQALLDAGAKLNIADKKGNQPLHYVLKKCKSEEKNAIVSLLLDRGAPVNESNKDGETPLYITCAEGDGFIGPVETLIKQGAKVNVKAKSGVSAFMKALSQGHIKVAQILVKSGATVQDQDEVL